jgi:hypothetical protein
MNWLKNLWIKIRYFYSNHKNIIVIALVVIIIAMLRGSCRNPEPVPITDINPILNQIKYLEDRNGQLVATVQQANDDLYNGKRINDSLAKALGVKPKQIKGVDQLVYKTDTVYLPDTTTPVYVKTEDTVNKEDGIVGYKVQKHDSYVDIVAVAGKDTGYISLVSRDTLTRTTVRKNPLFGASTTTVYIRNSNPYNKIQSGYSWVQKEKKTYISIGPSVSWNPVTNKVNVGIGISFPLIQLKR